MSEPVQTTLEEASRCPKCEQPSVFVRKAPVKTVPALGFRREVTSGATLHEFKCMNERCKWYDTICRVVQVNPDGSIPPAEPRRIKQFPAVPDRTREVGDALENQLRLEREGGAEVR